MKLTVVDCQQATIDILFFAFFSSYFVVVGDVVVVVVVVVDYSRPVMLS